MEILIIYLIAVISLLIGTAAIFMPLIPIFPYTWLYYHYIIRKPVNWSIFMGLISWTVYITIETQTFPLWTIGPLIISLLALILTYKMHQERAFQAVDFPEMTFETANLPIKDEMEMAIITYEGVTKCYPLDYVIHHHIINDKFNTKIVALTYCAMCRSIIPFDVTEIGPLFVGSFYNANMIVADRKTRTFFQQATFKSLIGRLHPYELQMIPFQILTWGEVKSMIKNPEVVKVSVLDFKQFELPIPGIWKKIVHSEKTPGLSRKKKDNTFPVRTHVIGITDPTVPDSIAYLRTEVINKGLVVNSKYKFFLVAGTTSVNAFSSTLAGKEIRIQRENKTLLDMDTHTQWDLLGNYLSGSIKESLKPITTSDEYWFSWKEFHPTTQVIRL